MIPKGADFYHGDDTVDFQALLHQGIIGVFHKASEGLAERDPAYAHRHSLCPPSMLWGAYHFMRPGDVAKQVQHFLDCAGPNVRYALDWEDQHVAQWSARRFMELGQMHTGQTPWLYAGGLLRGRSVAPAFAQFPLWLAEYSSKAVVPLPWKRYVLWQYTEKGKIAPDLSCIDVTDDEFRAAWNLTVSQPQQPTPQESV